MESMIEGDRRDEAVAYLGMAGAFALQVKLGACFMKPTG